MQNPPENVIGIQRSVTACAAGEAEGIPGTSISGGSQRFIDVLGLGHQGLDIDSISNQHATGTGPDHVESSEGSQSNEVLILQHQLIQLQRNQQLQLQEKQALEADFAQKRAKFKELFLAREAELVKEANSIQNERDQMRSELNELNVVAAFAESSKYEELNEVKQKHQQDIASMQKMVDEAVAVTTEEVGATYQQERLKLLEANDRLSEELQKSHQYINDNMASESDKGILSAVTKSFKSLTVSASTLKDSSSATAATATMDDASLEASMVQAMKDSDRLKSIIIPLEEELKKLKKKLQASERSNTQLNEQLQQLTSGSLSGKTTAPRQQLSAASVDLEERMQELNATLENEKSSRGDLEMYVAVLNKQKSVLQEEVDSRSKELVDVCKRLEKEKSDHDNLRRTWQMANDQFLEMQRLQMNDMRRFQAVLSAEQQRQLQEMQEKDREREEQELRIKNLQSMRDKHSQEMEEMRTKEFEGEDIKHTNSSVSSPTAIPFSDSHHNASFNSPDRSLGTSDLNPDDFLQFSSDSNSSQQYKRSISETSSIVDTPVSRTPLDLLDSGVHGMNLDTQSIASNYSLTEAQERAILSETPEGERMRYVVASVTAPSEFTKISSGQRIVSENEWSKIQEQIKQSREKLGRPCDMCVNYEQQLQKVQSVEIANRDHVAVLQMEVRQEEEKVKKEIRLRSELEESLKNAAEDAQRQICTLTFRNQESEVFLTLLRQDYLRTNNEMQDQLKKLIQSREQIYQVVTKLQEENQNLLEMRAMHTSIADKDGFQMPDTKEECQALLSLYREDIISVKVSIDQEKQKLQNEISFLKNQLESEQHTRISLDQTYQQELEEYKDDNVMLRSLKDELTRTTGALQDLRAKHEIDVETSKSDKHRSSELIDALKNQNQELHEIKGKLECHLRESKQKIHGLQTGLDNNEMVQHDLVKLSQSLQVQLENFRLEDNQVRWQHEDDVDKCNGCKQHLRDKKKRHHCMHCCQIFCTDCLKKSIESGPRRRKMPVCDVCYTLIVNESAPYFSKEAPDTS